MVKFALFLCPQVWCRLCQMEERMSINMLKANKMKKVLAVLLLLCSVGAFAQDVIVKRDRSTVVCKVLEVTDSEITYKKWSDLKGANYVMDISLVSAINYENGKKKIISELETLPQQNDQYDGTQSMSDAELLKLDEELNRESILIIQKTNQEKEYLQKKIKRLKTIGWIGGGALTATGIALLITGAINSEGTLIDNDNAALGWGSLACIVAGAGLTTTCLVKAHKLQKKIDAALQTSSIYRYNIPFSNGSSLSVGADMLNDRIMNKRTVGLGLSYNF